jgi:uncharacterized protein
MIYLLTAFGLGLFSSIHCIGMCGPIAVLIKQKANVSGILSNYHLGRILGYTILGLLFGLLGKGFSIAGLQQYISIILGFAMILYVFVPFFQRKSKQLEFNLIPYHKKLKKLFSKHLNISHPKNRFIIGLLNSLLPCGMIYLALIGAINAGEIWQGGVFMLFFGLGTLPLFALLLHSQESIKSPYFKRAIKKALPTLVLLMGIALILRGAGLGLHFSPSFGELSIATFKACFSPK